MSKFAVIIAAAGSGTRFASGKQKKTYVLLDGKPLWQHSVVRFAQRDDVAQILVVVSPDDVTWFGETYAEFLSAHNIKVVAGGKERFDSVENGLAEVNSGVEFVAIHDAARPCISDAVLQRVFSTARIHGSAVPTIPVSSTLKRSADGKEVAETVDRSGLYLSQTPQVFGTTELRSAFEQRGDSQPTDEAQLMESLGHKVHLTEGCPMNLKVTTKNDLQFATAAMATMTSEETKPIHFDGPVDDTKLR